MTDLIAAIIAFWLMSWLLGANQPVVSPIVVSPELGVETARPTASPVVEVSQIQTKVISEADLWQALVVYRQAHSRNPVIHEESLCRYGRKRVAEHEERLKQLAEGDSPLDGHSGFNRDGESGSLWQEIGGSFTNVGEVLAYIPNAQNATQVIEWGWDSSPAHREGLLSNDYTHACVVGEKPFFVGILGKM